MLHCIITKFSHKIDNHSVLHCSYKKRKLANVPKCMVFQNRVTYVTVLLGYLDCLTHLLFLSVTIVDILACLTVLLEYLDLLCNFYVHFTKIASISYASILLVAFTHPLCQKFCRQNQRVPNWDFIVLGLTKLLT